MKTDVNVPSKGKKQKNVENKTFFVGIFSATDEKSWWIRIQSGPVPKCHGSTRLV
jgi:hypothetical protein